MPLPSGISTTTVTFGTAVTNVTRTDLSMKVTFTPTSNLVWAATGVVLVALGETAVSGNDGNGSITLIDPWQPGFVNGSGNQIINWGYRTVAEYFQNGVSVLKTAEKVVTWTQATPGPIDLDLLIAIPSQTGIVVAFPDRLSAQITALTARVAALEAGTSTGGGGTTPSGDVAVATDGAGSTTFTGTGVADNGDGTGTVNSSAVTDNGDGTFTLVA